MVTIPEHTRVSLNNYVCNGIPTGSFLRAVLSNDLFEAFARADSINAANMSKIVTFVYAYVPRCCYGNEATVNEWLRLHRKEPEKTHQAVKLYQSRLDNDALIV